MQSLREFLIRTFVLLPDSYVSSVGLRTMRKLLHRARLLERRADEERVPFCRKDHGESTLTWPPFNSGKILERCARHDQDRINRIVPHQPPGFFLALAALLSSNRAGLLFQRRQVRDSRRQRFAVF